MPIERSSIDLSALAHDVMRREGFEPDFPPAVTEELHRLAGTAGPLDSTIDLHDLRELLWSSIDNDDSRDLDQIEVAERLANGEIRLRVGIADVDGFARRGSAIDAHAAQNATSVYTGVRTFPMIPEPLSFGVTSLLLNADRLVVVVEMTVDGNGGVRPGDVYRARVRNRAKLAYGSVGGWLETGGELPHGIGAVPGLEEQIRLQDEAAERLHGARLQDEAAERLHGARLRNGALDFETIESTPVVENGKVVDLAVVKRNRARSLIENLMIAANETLASYLELRGAASIQRVVRKPERWPRIVEIAERWGDHLPGTPDPIALSGFLARRRAADPIRYPDLSLSVIKLLGPGEYAVVKGTAESEGHFGLAVYHYSHSTAPNRRFADLATQRLLKAAIARGPAPYSEGELDAIAARCTEREDAARKVERTMHKAAAASLLQGRIGETFDGIVTGASPKGTYARVISPPVEGRIIRGEGGLDVGDRVRVRLIDAVPEKGFIDFAVAK